MLIVYWDKVKAAIRDNDPVLVIENLRIYTEKGPVPEDPEHVAPIGRAAIARPGTDLTVGLLPGTRWSAARFPSPRFWLL